MNSPSERCVCAGILVLIYGAANVAPTHKVEALLTSKKWPHL
jgi:hypothetical protein